MNPVLPAAAKPLLRGIRDLSGREIIQRITGLDHPQREIRALSAEDFYWILKKVDDQDALVLLEMASEEQWQYVLDLEIWKGDRLDLDVSDEWLGRLVQADPRRLVRWLFSHGEALAYYHLFRSVHVVVIEDEEELWNLPDGYFTVDGAYYVRPVDPERQVHLEHLLRVMAEEDHTRYQALLLDLAGVLPAELEEGMYRLRNVRLAEHGFLPPEEARAVYAPLDPAALERHMAAPLPSAAADEDAPAVPMVFLEHVGPGNVLTEAVALVEDPPVLDRIRMEFAGLCNQILSADGDLTPDLDTLVRTCQRASSYVNLGLERLGGKDSAAAAGVLERHSLVSLFRVGFGLALKVKWEAERWLKQSWFAARGLSPEFWGAYWGGVLAGVVEPRPRLFVGSAGRGGEERRDFEWLSDLGESLKVIRRLMVLDALLGRLTEIYPLSPNLMSSPDLSFRPLLFNLWARQRLKLQPSFFPITPDQATRFLETLGLEVGAPAAAGSMSVPGAGFVEDFMAFAGESDAETSAILKDTLELVWREFEEEYERIDPEDMDGRYSKFFTLRPS